MFHCSGHCGVSTEERDMPLMLQTSNPEIPCLYLYPDTFYNKLKLSVIPSAIANYFTHALQQTTRPDPRHL